MLAGMHSKSGKGTEEASNTGMEDGGPEAGKEGHCRIGAVVAGTEACVSPELKYWRWGKLPR